MKRIFKNILLISIASALIAGAAGCGGGGGGGGADVTGGGGEQTQPSGETTAGKAVSTLPAMDFDGEKVTVLTWAAADTLVQNDFFTEGTDGEPLNDAVYLRNSTIEERYNVELVYKEETRGKFFETARTSILSSSDDYSIVNGSVTDGNNLAQSGYLYDLNSLDYIDLSQAWWDARCVADLSIQNRVFFTMGEINTMANSQTWSFIYNKEMANEFGLANLYELTRNGEWTINKMHEMMQAVAGDLNGDNLLDQHDRWGLFTEEFNFYMHFLGSGEMVARKDSSDLPILTIGSDRGVSVLNDVYDIMTDKTSAFVAGNWSSIATTSIFLEHIIPMFMRGQGLFYYTGIGNTFKHLREMEFDFGIVPTPKYDENQDRYYNGVSNGWATVVSIPVTNKTPNTAAFVLEALSAESVDTVTDAYYNVLFFNKAVRDEESIEMVKLILNTRVFDIGYINNWGGVTAMFSNIVKAASMDFASRYASIESAVVTAMEETVELYKNIN